MKQQEKARPKQKHKRVKSQQAKLLPTSMVPGRLRDKDSGRPLAGLTVRVTAGIGKDAVVLSESSTDRQGRFWYNAPALQPLRESGMPTKDPAPPPERTELLIEVYKSPDEVLHSRTLKGPLTGMLEICTSDVPIEAPTLAVDAVLEASGLKASRKLRKRLEDNGITNLADARQSNALAKLTDLGDVDREVVRVLQARARFSTLTTKPAEITAMIAAGFDWPGAVARAGRRTVVKALGEKVGGVRALQLCEASRAQRVLLHSLGAGVAADAANGYTDGMHEQLGAPSEPPCRCPDCDSAVSPLAYLIDLLDYALEHLQHSDGSVISLQELQETFCQHLGALPTTCRAVEDQVRQIRIAVEVLRHALPDPPPDPFEEDEQRYLWRAYRALLQAIGTSHEELRLAPRLDTAQRERLASRLGIHLGSADVFGQLLLSPTAADPEKRLSEAALERLFGLVDTRRDPLSTGVVLRDPYDCLARWTFDGVEWGHNTDAEGRVYMTVYTWPRHHYNILIYRDREHRERLAWGAGAPTLGGGVLWSIPLLPMNHSNLQGSVSLRSGRASSVEISVVPQVLAWRLQYLRESWKAADWPEDEYTSRARPVIDPDLVGPGDFRAPLDGIPAFDLWRKRRLWVDAQRESLADIQGDSTAPRSQRLLEAMRTDISYTSAVTVTVWPADFDLGRLDMLLEQLTAGDDVEATVESVENELHLSVLSFSRLMEIWHTDRERFEGGATQAVSSAEFDELIDILLQARKHCIYPTWIEEEAKEELFLDGGVFWLSASEPVVGAWPPVERPLIDPEQLDRAAVPRSLAYWQIDELWAEAVKELENLYKDVRTQREGSAGIDGVLSARLGERIEDLEKRRDDLTSDNAATVAQAQARIVAELDLSVEDFGHLLAVMHRAEPSEEDLARFDTILVQRAKRNDLYPIWQARETHLQLDYWNVLPMQLVPWRASPEDRAAWREALRRHLEPPLIDPDVINNSDLRDPVSGRAAALWHQRWDRTTNGLAILGRRIEEAGSGLSAFDQELASSAYVALSNVARVIGRWQDDHGLAQAANWTLGRRIDELRDLATALDSPIPEVRLEAERKVFNEVFLPLSTFRELVGMLNQATPCTSEQRRRARGILAQSVAIGALVRLRALRDTGHDIRPYLAQFGLTQESYKVLMNYRDILAGGTSLLKDEWATAVSIMVQMEKRRLFARWRREEQEPADDLLGQPVLLGPDAFRLDREAGPLPWSWEGESAGEWRAPRRRLSEWRERLEARIQQQETVQAEFRAAVGAVEETVLPDLRTALINALGSPLETLEEATDRLSQRLAISLSTGAGQKTTRVSQAFKTLQRILWGARTGILPPTDWQLESDTFDADWTWLGSYATWRAAMFAHLYPENLLLPSLRREDRQTPLFREIVSDLRRRRRLDRRGARGVADSYSTYFRDVSNLNLKATCQARGRFGPSASPSTRLVVLGLADDRVYWSSIDPADPDPFAQSFWRPVRGLGKDVLDIIGAATVRTPRGKNSVLLLTKRRVGTLRKLSMSKYDLDGGDWDADDPEDLVLPGIDEEEVTDFDVRIDQSSWRPLRVIAAYRLPASNLFMCFVASFDVEHADWDYDQILSVHWDPTSPNECPSPVAIHSVDGERILVFFSTSGDLVQARLFSIRSLVRWEDFETVPTGENGWVQVTQRAGETVVDPETGGTTTPGPSGSPVLITPALSVARWLFTLQSPESTNTVYASWLHSGVRYTNYVTVEPDHLTTAGEPIPHTRENAALALWTYTAAPSSGPDDVESWIAGQLIRLEYDRLSTFPGYVAQVYVDDGQLHEDVVRRVTPSVNTRSLEGGSQGDMFAIQQQLSAQDKALRRELMPDQFAFNGAPGTNVNAIYLEEAYHFLPMLIAAALQQSGDYVGALDWYSTVYDFDAGQGERIIYSPLRDEESLPYDFERLPDWYTDPLNPHAVALGRQYAYTRFTLLSIVRCLLDYADSEFARDSDKSVDRAEALYEQALALLSLDVLHPKLDACEAIIGELDVAVGEPAYTSSLAMLKPIARKIGCPATLETTIGSVCTILADNDRPFRGRYQQARALLTEAAADQAAGRVVADVLVERENGMSAWDREVTHHPAVVGALQAVGESAANATLTQLSRLTGLPREAFLSEETRLLLMPASEDTTMVGEMEVVSPWLEDILPTPAPFVPRVAREFCVPPNPVVAAFRIHAELNLAKLRNGRNIAGVERELELYEAPVDSTTGVTFLGGGDAFPVARTPQFVPTPYRFHVLIERAKLLADLARQMEAAFLSVLEKRDAEAYSLLQARQDQQLARGSVRLQELRVREAEDSIALGELQRERAQTQSETYGEWISAGLNEYEQALLATYADIETYRQAQSAMAAAFKVGEYGIQAAKAYAMGNYGAAATYGGMAALAVSEGTTAGLAIAAERRVSEFQILASHARRAQEWDLQKAIADQDIRIADQQIRIAKDQLRVVGQERRIAELRLDHTEDTLEFLDKKFTNEALYDWMSGVLEGVYAFFLQQATGMAKLAESQLAFERQELPPPIIQSDYWEAPREQIAALAESGDGGEIDRRGLTGSARLLQDIYELDQFAFQSRRRKDILSKTFSLAQLAPAEFARFRETGVLRFATPMSLFDCELPGDYHRLIRRVRIAVIALVPPVQGIAARLRAGGISRIVSGGDVFQTREIRRPPESITLTAPSSDAQLLELQAQQASELLYPFEGMGVDTSWEFQLPRAANRFDFSTIADVLLTLEYTALHSSIYYAQVVSQLDRRFSGDLPYSMRHRFADQWYDLHNPDLSGTPMQVRFETLGTDFPPNLDHLNIREVLVHFAGPGASEIDEMPVNFRYREAGQSAWVGGEAVPIDQTINTLKGNAGAWEPLKHRAPVGTWELTLPDKREVRELFNSNSDEGPRITDILFVLTYSGETPEWPKN
jgi:hypothetical protein